MTEPQPLCLICMKPLSGKRSGDSWRCDHCKMWRTAVVRYADHLAAVQAAEQRTTERHNAEHEDDRLTAFQNGYAAALDKAHDAVRDIAMIGRGASMSPSGWVPTSSALAAIDALKEHHPRRRNG